MPYAIAQNSSVDSSVEESRRHETPQSIEIGIIGTCSALCMDLLMYSGTYRSTVVGRDLSALKKSSIYYCYFLVGQHPEVKAEQVGARAT